MPNISSYGSAGKKKQNPKKPKGLAAASNAKASQRINRTGPKNGGDLAAYRTGPGKSRKAVELESAVAKYFHKKRVNAKKSPTRK